MVTSDTNEFPEKLLLSARDLAVLLDIGERTLWRLDSMGKLPKPIRIGSLKKWRRHEIEAWIDAGCPDRTEWEAHQ